MSAVAVRLCVICGEHPGIYPVFLRVSNPNARVALGRGYDLTGNWCEICAMAVLDFCKAHAPMSLNTRHVVKVRKPRAVSARAAVARIVADTPTPKHEIQCPACGRVIPYLPSNTEAYCWDCGNVCKGAALERAKAG